MNESGSLATRLSAGLLALSALACASFAAQGQTPRATTTTRVRTPATTAAASQPTPQLTTRTEPQAATQVSEEEADLSITANVTARELKFEIVPNPVVEFPGRPRRETAWEAERTNLPRPVQPGVTYRDIGVRLKIVSVFADIERIVAEALGEVPTTDDQPSPPDATKVTSVVETTNVTNLTGATPPADGGGRAETPRRARAQRRAGRQR